MNLTEVEEALQQINGHLVTKKELQYIYHVCMYDDAIQQIRGVEQCWFIVEPASQKVGQQ